MIRTVVEETTPDPAKIARPLVLDLRPADARVDEQIVAEADLVAEGFQKYDMRLGNGFSHGGLDVKRRGQDVRSLQSVAFERFDTAIVQPGSTIVARSLIAIDHHLFVIAHDEMGDLRGSGPVKKPDQILRLRTAVDKIAEENEVCFKLARAYVFVDRIEQISSSSTQPCTSPIA